MKTKSNFEKIRSFFASIVPIVEKCEYEELGNGDREGLFNPIDNTIVIRIFDGSYQYGIDGEKSTNVIFYGETGIEKTQIKNCIFDIGDVFAFSHDAIFDNANMEMILLSSPELESYIEICEDETDAQKRVPIVHICQFVSNSDIMTVCSFYFEIGLITSETRKYRVPFIEVYDMERFAVCSDFVFGCDEIQVQMPDFIIEKLSDRKKRRNYAILTEIKQ